MYASHMNKNAEEASKATGSFSRNSGLGKRLQTHVRDHQTHVKGGQMHVEDCRVHVIKYRVGQGGGGGEVVSAPSR